MHGVGSYAAGALIGPARWPHYDLIVVAEGSLELEVGGLAIVCAAGDACLIPPGHGFRGAAGSGGTTIWVQHFAVAERAAEWIALPGKPARWTGVAQWEWPRTLMRRLSRLQKRPAAQASRASQMLLALLIEEFKSAEPRKIPAAAGAEKTVHFVMDWIEHHELPLPSLRKIAETAGWSVSYFRDQFRTVNGRPLGEFLKERRMGEAARLLLETNRPIKEIAVQAGYTDVAAFHRAFLRRYKVTPGHYRDHRESLATV